MLLLLNLVVLQLSHCSLPLDRILVAIDPCILFQLASYRTGGRSML